MGFDTNDPDRFVFFFIPKVLLTDKYKELSSDAKILYSLLMDRDTFGYSMRDIQDIIGISDKKLDEYIHQLKKAGLINL